MYQGVFYRLHGSDGVLRNPSRPLTGEAMRELRLEVTTGQAGSVRTVELGWVPPRVIFVASGPKPYLLAVGAAETGTAAVTPALEFAEEILTPGLAWLAAPLALGGKAALEPRLEINWKTVLLWGLLLAGTVMILLMVWRLAHSTNRP